MMHEGYHDPSNYGMGQHDGGHMHHDQQQQQQLPWVPRASTCVGMDSIHALTFDCREELLWACDTYGTVRSFQPQVVDNLEWYAYSAFSYFQNTPCISVVSTPDLLWTASTTSIRAQKRGGATVHRIDVPNAVQRRIYSIVPDKRSDSILFHGETTGIMQVFYETSCDNIGVITADPVPSTCMVSSESYLLTGSSAGDVVLRDPRTFGPITRMRSDGRVHDAKLVNNETQVVVLSGHTVKLFDMRQPTAPVARVQPQSQLTKLIKVNDREVLGGGPVGIECFALADGDGGLDHTYSLDLTGNGMCTTFAISQNGECLAVGTDKAIVHALSLPSTVEPKPEGGVSGRFRNTNEEVAPSSATVQPPVKKWGAGGASYGVDDDEEDMYKLMERGFDYDHDGELASDWPAPNHMILAVEGRPPVIPQQLREIATQPIENHYGASRIDTFRPNPKDKLNQFIPNPWPFNEVVGDDPTTVAQQLIQYRKQRKANRTNKSGNLAYSKLDEALQVCYPSLHQPFDWKAYNQSRETIIGLDNSLRESWINAFLHSLFYLQAPHYVFRKTLMKHVCKRAMCLSCEVAGLFWNMNMQAQNHTQPIMQPTNLLRTMRQIPEFVEARVFEPAKDRDDQVAQCHTMVKIFLELIDAELRRTAARPNEALGAVPAVPPEFIASIFGTELQLTQSKQPINPRFYWEVPASASKVDEGLQHLLKQLERYRGEAVSIRNLPPVLLLLLNPEHGHLRPPPSLKFSRPNEEYNYVLTSNIIHLAEDADDPGTFVLHNKMPDPTLRTEPGKAADAWVVMNDYCISAPVPSEDTLETLIPSSVNHSTVVTCYILDKYRQYRGRDDRVDVFSAAGNVLLDDWARRELLQKRMHGLEPPRRAPSLVTIPDLKFIGTSDIVAIDAEYIQLQWGNEVRGDEPEWVLNQRKPFMALARVSCVLSKEPGDERTIIDDYVVTNEPVRDYVTKYSGIHPGDLDAKRTPYALTSLKNAVLKLRCLVDRGVRFLGHGLSQDFRVINLAVPKYKIIDTLELFHRKGHRYLSLRFLAYHLLEERVQDDEHDSIVDARTSLRLYRKYDELIRRGEFESTMDRLLEIGAETNFYVPDPDSGPSTPSTAGLPVPEVTTEGVPPPDTPEAPKDGDSATSVVASPATVDMTPNTVVDGNMTPSASPAAAGPTVAPLGGSAAAAADDE